MEGLAFESHPMPGPPLPPIDSFYRNVDSTHRSIQWNGMAATRRETADRLLMDFHQPVDYPPQPPLNGARPLHPAPRNAPMPLDNSQVTSSGHPIAPQQIPRDSSLDSAISISSVQGMSLKQIGLYTLHEKIGIGMYGAVRRATHKVTKSQVAIKIIKKGKLREYRSALIRVYREIEVQKRLNHPFVLDIFQIMETDDRIYLVTELCKGGELFNLIQKRRRLSEQEARKYFCQLIVAVQYCHEKGVVHRDIKAENLLLDEFGSIKLADFGFANFYDDSTLLGTFCGSPQYAAPEVFLGKKYQGTPLDIWSMGVILHVFLTGRTPFEGRNFNDIQDRVLHMPIEYPYYVSPEAAQLMNLMINRNADQRATLKQVMSHRWVKCDDIPSAVNHELQVHHYITELVTRDPSKDCLTALGITEIQIKESHNRFDNVDGINRLLVKEYRTRRLRRVWGDPQTMNAIIAASLLQSEGRPRIIRNERIDGAPVAKELAIREKKIEEEAANQGAWSKFLPGPEEYPYTQFMEEERREKEQDMKEGEKAKEETKLEVAPTHTNRSVEIADFEEAQQAKCGKVRTRTEKNLQSVDSSEGYSGDTSAMSTISPSLKSLPSSNLKRIPSDVCNRLGGLDIQKRRSVVESAGEQASLSKRPSLPECLATSADPGILRGAIRLADPPKKKADIKTFFERMRFKQKKAHGISNCRVENGQTSTRFLPPPSLPEGGSFDDCEDIKPNEESTEKEPPSQ